MHFSSPIEKAVAGREALTGNKLYLGPIAISNEMGKIKKSR
jgi:hypothetical protein